VLLVHLVDGSAEDPLGDFEAVRTELELFSPWLAAKPCVVALNKRDVPSVREAEPTLLAQLQKAAGHKRVLPISAATTENTELLMKRLAQLLPDARARTPPPDASEAVLELDTDMRTHAAECQVVSVGEGEWRLQGTRIEKAAAMTNWDYAEAQDRFQRIMKALGASEELKKAGAKNGDLIMVGAVDFAYFEESPMAARARLAGLADFGADERGGAEDDEEPLLSELEEEARRLAKELDDELAELLDSDGDILTF